MISLSGMRIVVAGGGAIGSATALAVLGAGAKVVLVDPASLGDNASGVAAGMLAPAFEAVLDPVSAGHFDLYRQARDLWPAFAASIGFMPDPCGALWVARDRAEREDMTERLESVGAFTMPFAARHATRRAQGLSAPAGGVFTPDDWRLEPRPMLAAMRAAFEREGGRMRDASLLAFEAGRARLSDGEVAADAVVLASGLPPAGFEDSPAETSLLFPIKGQILRAEGFAPRGGPVVRGQGVYVVPGQDGPWIGATMETGTCDRRIDAETSARLKASAAGLFPDLAQASVAACAGVRAATSDGLPLVGESSRPGVFLALGARRNGWLLAPMVADLVVKSLAGGDLPARLHSRRFDVDPS